MLDRHLIAKTAPRACPENIVRFGDYRITVLADRLFRIENDPSGRFCDEATQAVWFRNMAPQSFTVRMHPESADITTDRVRLHITADFRDSRVDWDGQDRPLTNAGNLKGTYRTLDTCIGDWSETEKKHIGLSDGVCSRTGVAILDDGASLLLTQKGQVAGRPAEKLDVYVFAYGHDYRAAVRALFAITGPPPLLPRWAFGNWWSRYFPYTDRKYVHLLDRFAERGIPFTVAMVDMDWHYAGDLRDAFAIPDGFLRDPDTYGPLSGPKAGWTGYSWNRELFPDPADFLKKVRARHAQIAMNLHPADGIRFFEDAYPEMAEAMGIDPDSGVRIPFDMTDDTFISNYFRVMHKPNERAGVDFWWVDWQQGTRTKKAGLDPLWSLNHYHYLDAAKDHPEPLILSRYAGIGSHRYPVGFSGDTHVEWASLDYLPYFTATASNVGYTWWSHDIGGHMHGIKDDELYVRYVQFGVFSPINRLHSTSHEVFTKEPWVYENGTGRIAADFLALRHKMIPYLYSAACRTHEEGTALVEPLYYAWPEAREAYRHPNQYLFAGSILVAPVTSRSEHGGLSSVQAWIPEGTWTDLFTGTVYTVDAPEGRTVTLVRPLDSIPVLVPAGGTFVLSRDNGAGNRIGCPPELDVQICSGTGSYILHEGDAVQPADTIFTHEGTAGRQTCTIRFAGDASVLPPDRRLILDFRNILEGRLRGVSATADGVPLDTEVDDNETVTVAFPFVPGVSYRIEVDHEPESEMDRLREHARYVLGRMQGGNDDRSAAYDLLCTCATPQAYRAAVGSLGLHPLEEGRLLESLTG